MSIKLIYHTPESASGGVSPFDEAIIHITTGEDVLIACPYLSLSYLERIINLSKSWRVLTDIEEWLASHNHTVRVEIQNFISQYSEYIRHVQDLHTKVIIAGQKALVGSANFTNRGITGRIEMSVLFEEEPQVGELLEWFDYLWLQSEPVSVEELQACARSIPAKAPANRDKPRISSQVPPIRSRLKSVEQHRGQPVVTPYGEATSEQLVERVKFAPSREWIDGYLDLMKLLLEATGLTSDDPRLVTSMPQSKWSLPVSINNRYVLAPWKQDDFGIGIIYGPEFELMPHLQAQAVSVWRFSPLRGEGIDTPFFIRFKDARSILESPEIKDGWLRAALREVARAKSSPYRKYHQPVVYEAAVNLDYRAAILEKAFPVVPKEGAG